MNIFKILVWAGILALLPFAIAAQPGSGGWCSNNNYAKTFNPDAIETLQGVVVSIEKITPEKGMSIGIHLMVKTEKNETISIHLGPSWYLDNQDIQFFAGDAISVTGSRVTYKNAPAIIAMRVEKGALVLTLRNKKGSPGWNGWKKGRKGGRNRAKN